MEFFESMIGSHASSRLSTLVVRTTGEKSCWVALPPALVNRLIDGAQLPQTLQLTQAASAGVRSNGSSSPTWHVAWQGAAATSGHNIVEVPAQLAALLGISDGTAVDVRMVSDVAAAVSVTVEPANVDDWEVVESNAEYLTDQMLHQVGMVAVGQPFPFWVHGKTMLTLKVSAAVPADLVRLVHGCEVYVAPRPRQRTAPAASDGSAAGTAQSPARAVEPLPPVWLRIQEAGSETLVLLEAAVSDAQDGDCAEEGAEAWCTTLAWVSPHVAASQHWQPGDTVLVTCSGERGQRVQHLHVAISNSAAPGHVMLSPATVAMLQTAAHRHARLQAAQPATRPVPRLMSLLPLVLQHPGGSGGRAAAHRAPASSVWGDEGPISIASALAGSQGQPLSNGSTAGSSWQPGGSGSRQRPWLRFLTSTQLSRMFASWLAAQANAAGGGTDGPTLLQDGTVVALRHPDTGCSAYFGVQLQRGLSLDEGGSVTVLVRPEDVRPKVAGATGAAANTAAAATTAADCRVELGSAVPMQVMDVSPHPPPKLRVRPAWLQASAAAALRHALPLLSPASRAALATAGAPPPGAGLLLSGGPGSGKTALAAWLADALGSGCMAHSVYLDCSELAGDATLSVHKALHSRFAEAVACMPALLILDGLEVVCPTVAAGGDPGLVEPGGDALVAWLCDVLAALRAPSRLPVPVVVVATCNDAAELAEPLRAAGRLDALISLPAPGPAQREAILTADLVSRGVTLPAGELQAAAAQMEGYDASDMAALLDRAMLGSARRHLALAPPVTAPLPAPKQPPTAPKASAALRQLQLREPDLAAARQGFSPAAFWGIGRPADATAGVQGWEEVGGLAEVKAALREALELPARAPALVAAAPLRLRTGALLYGPPGCGKTHAVRAAAAAAGLRLIAVSGPEVLNKYIGASEAAVRDLFRRAAAAAPCVLFFDEFDSIAPQRGHDSTGVTDRVVNQLLTELDGVEGLKGVSVVGATSRPDLLDAALLRPGRLDRLLLCDFPDAPARVAIVHALARRMPLAADAQLDAMAAGADGFTGADLRALLTEAQLAAVHEALDAQDTSPSSGAGPSQAPPLVTNAHLRAAFNSARPSVSRQEAAQLTALYSRFRQGRDPGWGGATAAAGQRVTLA